MLLKNVIKINVIKNDRISLHKQKSSNLVILKLRASIYLFNFRNTVCNSVSKNAASSSACFINLQDNEKVMNYRKALSVLHLFFSVFSADRISITYYPIVFRSLFHFLLLLYRTVTYKSLLDTRGHKMYVFLGEIFVSCKYLIF